MARISIIAPSFGGVYYYNCFPNEILPIEVDIENVRSIAGQMTAAQGHAKVMVDLETQTVTAPDGSSFAFSTPPTLRDMLLSGANEIDVTLGRADTIDTFRMRINSSGPAIPIKTS